MFKNKLFSQGNIKFARFTFANQTKIIDSNHRSPTLIYFKLTWSLFSYSDFQKMQKPHDSFKAIPPGTNDSFL